MAIVTEFYMYNSGGFVYKDADGNVLSTGTRGDTAIPDPKDNAGVFIHCKATDTTIYTKANGINVFSFRLQDGTTGGGALNRNALLELLAENFFFVDNPNAPGGDDHGNLIFIRTLADLPAPVSGIITLAANKTYFFVPNPAGVLDLLGSRLQAAGPVTLLGGSSETSSITSTGLNPGQPLFSSNFTAAINFITFKDVGNAIQIRGDLNPPVALDWTGVNFVNVPFIGTINSCDNFIFTKGSFLNSKGLKFRGNCGTIAINNSLLSGDGAADSLVEIEATAVITRRFRITYSAVIASGSTTGIDVNAAATIPNQGFILDTCSFSGGGTYLPGVGYLDNKALFDNNTGINNSAEISHYYMRNNATATAITIIGQAEKVAGTTTSAAITQKFTNTDNRATYTGAIKRFFSVTATASLNSGNNNQIGLYIAKNGNLLTESEIYVTTNGAGRAESAAIQTLVELSNGDFIEVFAENSSALNNITVTELNVVII